MEKTGLRKTPQMFEIPVFFKRFVTGRRSCQNTVKTGIDRPFCCSLQQLIFNLIDAILVAPHDLKLVKNPGRVAETECPGFQPRTLKSMPRSPPGSDTKSLISRPGSRRRTKRRLAE